MLTRSWYWKPPQGTQVDWSNPLTSGLIMALFCNEVAGTVNDPVSGIVLTPDANARWGAGQYGIAAVTNNASGARFSGLLPDSLKVQPPATLIWSGSFLGTPTNSAQVVGNMYDNVPTPPYGQLGMLIDASKFIGMFYGVSAGSNNIIFSTAVATNKGRTWFAATASSNAQAIYVDNPIVPANTATTPISSWVYTSTSDFGLGTVAGIPTRNGACSHDYCFMWNRVLTTNELMSIYMNPWQLACYDDPVYGAIIGGTYMPWLYMAEEEIYG